MLTAVSVSQTRASRFRIGGRMRQILVLSNPKAGRGKSMQTAERLARAIAAVGWTVGRSIGQADELPEAAVVIGGDGSLRYAANALLTRFGQVPPLLVIPAGTANLMAQHLQLQWDMPRLERQVIAALRAGKTRLLDVAKANGELFTLIAGVGFDAAVVAALDRVRVGPISKWSYVMPSLQALWSHRFVPIEVFADNQRIFGPRAGLCFVGNVKEYGTGIPVLPAAKPDDGLLDVGVLPCESHGDLVKLALHVAAGEQFTMESARYAKARSVTVFSEEPVPVQLDGDSAGMTPLHIELLPARVPFIVR